MPDLLRPSLRVELEEILLVASGAIPGALLRWQMSQIVQDRNLLVNIAGAALLGCLTGMPVAPRRTLLLGIGFCGSITTFSSWMLDVVKLLSSGATGEAIGLIGLTLGGGLGAAGLGFLLGRQFRPPVPPRSPS
ncbi:MAG: chromosome condensation protein CrcB [Synechococcus sp. MED850]|jgi:CrcB protein|nr:chromosome condensation protein CrcB [Synechococcus sp. MED850]